MWGLSLIGLLIFLLTSMGKRSRLGLSSSGGGLFGGRPKTQTWVWGAFVFGAGLCPDKCPAGPADEWAMCLRMCKSQRLYKFRHQPRSATILIAICAKYHHPLGLRGFGNCKKISSRDLFLERNKDCHAFHKLSTGCGAGVVAKGRAENPSIPAGPCRPERWTQSGWIA